MSGRFVNVAGTPLPGLTVMIAPIDVVPLNGKPTTPPLLGRATTGDDGTWSLTLPAKLPASVWKAAADNNGTLNIEATVNGIGEGQNFIGSEIMAVPVLASSAADASGSSGVSPSMVPAPSVTAPPGLVVVDNGRAASSAPTSPPTTASWASQAIAAGPRVSDPVPASRWQDSSGPKPADYNPDIVNGADYSNVVPMDAWCDPWSWTTQKTTTAWTTVGAAHDYWNSNGWFTYSKSGSTTIGSEVSADGATWSFGGWDEQSNYTGISVTTPALASKTARQFRIPIKYAYQHGTQVCQYHTSHEDRIVGRGWHKDPVSNTAWKWGKSVLFRDGQTAWENSNPGYRLNARRGATWSISSGKSLTVGVAASAFGVGIKAYTTYSSQHVQSYQARWKTARWHHIWGVKGDVVGTHPGQIRAY